MQRGRTGVKRKTQKNKTTYQVTSKIFGDEGEPIKSKHASPARRIFTFLKINVTFGP